MLLNILPCGIKVAYALLMPAGDGALYGSPGLVARAAAFRAKQKQLRRNAHARAPHVRIVLLCGCRGAIYARTGKHHARKLSAGVPLTPKRSYGLRRYGPV